MFPDPLLHHAPLLHHSASFSTYKKKDFSIEKDIIYTNNHAMHYYLFVYEHLLFILVEEKFLPRYESCLYYSS